MINKRERLRRYSAYIRNKYPETRGTWTLRQVFGEKYGRVMEFDKTVVIESMAFLFMEYLSDRVRADGANTVLLARLDEARIYALRKVRKERKARAKVRGCVYRALGTSARTGEGGTRHDAVHDP